MQPGTGSSKFPLSHRYRSRLPKLRNCYCAGVTGFADLWIAVQQLPGLIRVIGSLGMDRAQNLTALAAIAVTRNSVGEAQWQKMVNSRRVAYLYRIVECMLTEEVAKLPDTYSPNPV